MSGAPAEIVSKLAARGVNHIYVDGGITIQAFLRAGLIQRLIITRVPLLIGEGIPLFGALPGDVRLKHVATRHYPSWLVQTEYQVLACQPYSNDSRKFEKPERKARLSRFVRILGNRNSWRPMQSFTAM